MGKIKKLKGTDLIGGINNEDVYPITSTKAVFDEKNTSLHLLLNALESSVETVKETANSNTSSILQEVSRAKTVEKQLEDSIKKIEPYIKVVWNYDSNINTYIDSGIYNIKGVHLRKEDNLPLESIDAEATFNANLIVLDSTINVLGGIDGGACITQILSISDRVGSEGNIYIRTGRGYIKTVDAITWDSWSVMQTTADVGLIKDEQHYGGSGWIDGKGMNSLGKAGFYRGVYFDTSESFFLIVIDNKQAANSGLTSLNWAAQFKYGLPIGGGEISLKVRRGAPKLDDLDMPIEGEFAWGEWKDFGGGSVTIEAQAPLAQKDGKLTLNIGDGLKVEDNKLVATPQSSSDTSNALRALFIAAGAEYNDSGVDIIKTTPWAAFVDDIEYKAQNNIDVLNYTTVDLHSIVQDGTTYNYVIDNGIYKVVGRASRGQIVHDERYTVHRAGHYYLNGLGDITEEQMMLIYNRTATPVNKYISYFRMQNESDLPYIPRTNILSDAFFAGMTFENLNSAFYASSIEVFKASGNNDRNFAAIPEFGVATLGSAFERSQMKYFIGALNIKKQSTTDTQYIGGNAPNLRVLLFKNLCGNLKTFNTAANISKASLLFAINNSIATTAITITLHPTAYARFKDNPEVVAALESKSLVTLVSA